MCHFTSINFTKSKRNAEIKRVLKVFSSGYQLFPSSFIFWRVLDIFRIIKMFCFCLWVILWWYMDATRASHWWMKFFYHLHPLYFLETWWIYLFILLEQIKSTLLSRCERFHTSFRRKCLLLCLLGIYMWVPVFKKKKESEKTLHELHNINEQKYADRHIWSGDIFQEHFWTSISKKGTNVTILY